MKIRSTPLIVSVAVALSLFSTGSQANSSARTPAAPVAQPGIDAFSSQDLLGGHLGDALSAIHDPLRGDAAARDLATDMNQAYMAWKRAPKN